LSLTTELEGLVGEKAQLKGMLQSIEEEEKYLGKRLRIVEEKIEIKVLKEKIKAKRAVVEQLKSRIWNLEKRLKETQRKPEPSPVTKAPTPEVTRKVEEPQEKEPTEVMISAAPASQQPKQSEEQKEEQQETKKRRFFP